MFVMKDYLFHGRMFCFWEMSIILASPAKLQNRFLIAWNASKAIQVEQKEAQ